MTLNSKIFSIPNPKIINKKVQILDPNFISMKLHSNSSIPMASPCLIDTLSILYESYYALKNVKKNYKKILTIEPHEKYIQIGKTYHIVSSSEPHEKDIIGLIKFYSEDVILRLFAAAEHLSNSIVFMLKINKAELSAVKSKWSNLSIILGQYLVDKLPNNPITIGLIKLKDNPNWTKALAYRNDWIHNQPPYIEGLGVVYKRKSRWMTSSLNYYKTGKKLKIISDGGDKPDFSIDELVGLCINSYKLFFHLFTNVVDYYYRLLSDNNIDLSNNVFR